MYTLKRMFVKLSMSNHLEKSCIRMCMCVCIFACVSNSYSHSLSRWYSGFYHLIHVHYIRCRIGYNRKSERNRPQYCLRINHVRMVFYVWRYMFAFRTSTNIFQNTKYGDIFVFGQIFTQTDTPCQCYLTKLTANKLTLSEWNQAYGKSYRSKYLCAVFFFFFFLVIYGIFHQNETLKAKENLRFEETFYQQ